MLRWTEKIRENTKKKKYGQVRNAIWYHSHVFPFYFTLIFQRVIYFVFFFFGLLSGLQCRNDLYLTLDSKLFNFSAYDRWFRHDGFVNDLRNISWHTMLIFLLELPLIFFYRQRIWIWFYFSVFLSFLLFIWKIQFRFVVISRSLTEEMQNNDEICMYELERNGNNKRKKLIELEKIQIQNRYAPIQHKT